MAEVKVMGIKNIADISGFGKDTPYEQACQIMLQAGYEWIVKHQEAKGKLKASTIKGVYGILTPESKEAKQLSEAVLKSVPDCTGAMHHAVMGHLMFISANGIEKWKREVTKK